MKGIKEVIASFGFKDFTWYDITGVMQLGRRTVATITLAENGCQNHFVGFKVQVADKEHGVIASKFFHFDDYMHEFDIPEAHKARGYQHEGGLHVWRNSGQLSWYIATPTKKCLAEYTRAITNFILEFDMGV